MGNDDANARYNQTLGSLRLYILRYVDKIICVSEKLSDTFINRGFVGEKIETVRYAVDCEKFYPVGRDEKKSIRKKLKIPEGSKVVTFVGRICERKNVAFLVEVFCNVLEEVPNAFLVLVGPYSNNEEYLKKVSNAAEINDCKDRIKFAGRVNNVPMYLKASDIYASAAKAEGLPISVIEAMACANACVLMYMPQAEELIPDRSLGIVANRNDMSEFKSALCYLLNNKIQRKKIGQASSKRIRNEFSLKKRINKIHKLIHNI
jgi:glycosyltransferase involved in cell wall biosynthesis